MCAYCSSCASAVAGVPGCPGPSDGARWNQSQAGAVDKRLPGCAGEPEFVII